MTLQVPGRKADVLIRHERGKYYPALNVKRYQSPEWSASRINEHFKCGEDRAEKVAAIVYECCVEDFWRDSTAAALSSAFGEHHGLEVFSAGRMGGTLIVEGLPPVESWDAVTLGRWRKFASLIKSEIEYMETWDFGRDMIEANEWAPAEDSPAGERQKIKDNRSAERCALEAFFAIHGELDGKEWSPDTLERIAAHVRGAGLTIREPEEETRYVAT